MASKRRIRRNQCTGKVRHPDAFAATSAIGALNRTRGYQGRMNSYLCQFCNGWHIGHAPKAGNGPRKS